MSMEENHCDCIAFDEGDWVESKLNTDVFGIVVGGSDFGRHYHVQIAGSLEIRMMFAVTLRHMAVQGDEPPVGGKQKPPAEADNVIDFTKERKLRKTTTTEGAA
ncbi:hypothetical protein [Rhizobium esperanzae]|uniref:Uncharacterized protein n=1 Tax=Rhizobium esperanzae TaxID=1967781 RepID=A0A7W6R1Q5_9HYPH|nr:hypothetical protein [Rhizobium esperanzae]MBB4235089.1 hypothetical protein [Rhizobium esperanzae]